MLAITAEAQQSYFESVPFISGQEGYNTYRIPAIVRTTNGTLLAFCEGRKNSASDSGDIDIVLKRSTNGGLSWQPMILVQEEGGAASITIGNPAPVLDAATGYIHLLFCRNNDRVFHTVSTNDGVTWSARDEITAQVKLANWGFYATGPGHGVQLKRGAQAGRLVVACDHVTTNNIYGAQVVYSDDHGATWHLGAINEASGGVNPNETMCEELVASAPGGGSRLYFNTRDESGTAAGTRGESWSTNGGNGFAGSFTNRPDFLCPVVQGSLVRLRGTDQGSSSNRVLFACPNGSNSRINLSVWSSTNECLSWFGPKLLYAGPSAYSDMARVSEGTLALLYERGNASPYETITLACFNDAWLDAAGSAAEVPGPAFWNFEENPVGQYCSTNVRAILDIDPAGQNNHLTAQTNFLYVVGATNFGSGTALHFNGADGLQLTDSASSNHFDYSATDSFTIEAVFRIPAGSTQVGALVAKDYGSLLPSWWLRVDGGQVRFLVSDTQTQTYISTTKLINDGNWHHVAAVRDASNPAGKSLRLYLDGVLDTTGTDATTGSLANAQPFNIGRFGSANTRNLTGDIDMVRITPQALAPTGFLGKYTQFDADQDLIPDAFERTQYGSLSVLSSGDADGDGWSDLLEFVFGSDPLSQSDQFTVIPGAYFVQVVTRQRALPAWLTVQLESSLNLVSWQTCSGSVVLTPLDGGLYLRSQTIPFPTGAPDHLFFRCRLDQLP